MGKAIPPKLHASTLDLAELFVSASAHARLSAVSAGCLRTLSLGYLRGTGAPRPRPRPHQASGDRRVLSWDTEIVIQGPEAVKLVA